MLAKRLWGFALVLILVLMLFVTASAAGETLPPALEYAWWGDAALTQATQTGVSRFVTAQKGAFAPLLTHPFETRESYAAWLLGQLPQGGGGDVVELDTELFRQLALDDGGAPRFFDLETFPKLGLTQFSYWGLLAGTAGGRLCALPMSMTSHVFFWNLTALTGAGLQPPESLLALKDAAQSLGANGHRYPLAATAEGRVALMITHLQSKYGKPWLDAATGSPAFSSEEVAQGLTYLQDLETWGVLPKLSEQGEIETGFQEGRYLGVWVWDSQAQTFGEALPQGSKTQAIACLTDWGPYAGGFQKPLRMIAISQNTKDPAQAAKLLEFLLNSDKGARALKDLRGTPASQSGFGVCNSRRLLNKTRSEANRVALSWARYPMPLGFDAAFLAGPGGVYEQVLLGLSEGHFTPDTAAAALLSGVKAALRGGE